MSYVPAGFTKVETAKPVWDQGKVGQIKAISLHAESSKPGVISVLHCATFALYSMEYILELADFPKSNYSPEFTESDFKPCPYIHQYDGHMT